MTAKLLNIQLGEGQRTRRVVSRSNYRVTGKFPSIKKKDMAHWESPLERDAFRRLDADPAILGYEEQPAIITYKVDGKVHTHYPDILVHRESGQSFVEVKPDRKADDARILMRTAVLGKILPPAGYAYQLWRKSEIHQEPQLGNAIHLLRFSRHPVSPLDLERVRRLFGQVPTTSWGSLTKSLLGDRGLYIAARLVIDGWLIFDTSQPIEPDTPIRFNVSKGVAP